MATGACSVGQGECAAGMTSLAADDDMRSIEFEPGTEVVEFALRQDTARRKQKCGEHKGYSMQPLTHRA